MLCTISPTGNTVNYLSVGAVFEFVWNCLVTIGTTIVNLVSSLVQAGIDLVCTLTSSAIAAITSVVNEIVDAFNAFVSYAIELITSTLSAVFGPLIDSIKNLWNNYWQGVSAALAKMKLDHITTGQVSPRSLNDLSRPLNGELFLAILGVTVLISISLIALTVVTNVFSFLLSMAMTMLVMFIFENAFSKTVSACESPDSSMTYGSDYDNISVAGAKGVVELSESEHPPAGSEEAYERNILFNVIGAAIGIMGAHIGIAALGQNPMAKAYVAGIVGITVGLVAAALAIPASIIGDDILGAIALCYGILSLGAGIVALAGGKTTFERGAGWASLLTGGLSRVFSTIPLVYHPQGD